MRKSESSVLSAMPTITAVIPASGFPPVSIPHPVGSNWPRVRGYEILSVIGVGGMGIVYKARQRDLHRTVAIKTLRGAALADPEFHGRFQAEAEAVARLQHPNIIQVFEIGTVESYLGDANAGPYISLEFVDGGSLNRRTERPQTPKYAAEMVEKLARAVNSAHRLGVVHRDLKPANVLLTPDGEPKIADFGLAKQLGTERDAGGRFFTQAGTVVGTPEYMAPEQATGEAPTTAVDIYALGVILYELLTARVPFHAATPVETMNLLQRQEPVPPRQLQPGLPRDLETICLKCLEKEPSKRYASAEALADDLRSFLENRPIKARRLMEIEKVARWCRRNPMVAGSLAGVVGMFLAAFILVTRSYWRAEVAFQNEAHQRSEAERKERDERWERYRANIVAAASALRVNSASTARNMLMDTPEEFRNWEWNHFLNHLDLSQHVLRSDDAEITAANVTPNGKFAIVYGDDGFARVWDTIKRKEVQTFRQIHEIWNATLSNNGKLLAYRMKDNTVTVRDVESGRIHTVLRGHEAGVHTISFNSDVSRILTAANDGTIRVWDSATGEQLRVYHPHKTGVASNGVNPDGRKIISSEPGKDSVRYWDLETGEQIAMLPGHEHGLQGFYFSQNGDRFVTTEGFPKNTMKLWNGVDGKFIGSLGSHTNTVTHVRFSPDGTRIASSSMDQTVRLWDAENRQLLFDLRGHNGRVTCIAFSPDGKHLVSGSEDHTLRLWDTAMGICVSVLNGHTAAVEGLAYTPDGSQIVSASTDGTVRIWDARTVENHGILRGHTTFVYSVAFHPDGQRVASAGWDGTVRIWDATTGRQKALLKHTDNPIITSVAFDPAGRLLASRTRGSIFLWDVDAGKELHRWNAPSDLWRDTRLAFSSDGTLLASGCRGGEVRLWDVKSLNEVAVLRGHQDEVRDVAFSPDGKWLATAGEVGDKTIRIWNVATKEQAIILEGHSKVVYALAFSHDGKRLASGSTDGTARLWDTSTWDQIAEMKHGSSVYGVAFTPDGTRLACACADNSIRLWDPKTQQSVAELRGHNDYVHSVAFSPDGSRLVSASGDCTVRVWDTVPPQERASGK